ncbi:ABC transporter ATP-binding protein [Actinoalloteichus caeruleus]|uniref:ABC transporter ATP-binding protein n=1 Tax=Actinoalloteichus cyanogriseus TaxID=2893586 RepID=UPI0004AB3BA2|nr:ABC transporter ATP-binding protein [Actinoalloteichus caeruleus]
MPVIEVEGLRKTYRDHVAVDDVSFSVESGEIFGILGPNGAGKTTTVECLTGLRRRDGGRVSVFGHDPDTDRDALRETVGVQLQHSELQPKMTVREALGLYASFYADPADPDELIDTLGLRDRASAYWGKLSGGQRQRVAIALALVGNPRLAVLDELTTGLDPKSRRDTWEVVERVRDRGVTVLLVTHFMAEAQHLCDRIAVIARGRVAALDTPEGLASAAGSTQCMRFHTTQPVPVEELRALPVVTEVVVDGAAVTVRGEGELVFAVSQLLGAAGVTPSNLRVEQASLDDAFLAITGQLTEEAA